jgi:hypothetical protein
MDETIGSGVTSIGDRAFDGCKGLTDVTIGSDVTSIGAEAFDGCTSLSGLILPPSVTSVGLAAFRNMGGENGVVWFYCGHSYEYAAYWGAANMGSYYVLTIEAENGTVTASGENTPDALAEKNYFWPYDTVTLTVTPDDGKELISLTVTADGEAVAVDNNAFKMPEADATVSAAFAVTAGSCGDNVTWSFAPANGTLTISGTGAMADYAHKDDQPWAALRGSITAVEIGGGVTSVGQGAFEGCKSLTGQLVFPDGLASIGTGAFAGCSGLSGELVIPAGVTSIGSSAFSRCTGLTKLTDNSGADLPSGAFSGCSELAEAFVAGKVGENGAPLTTICTGAFGGCYKLETLTLGDGVKAIGEGVFPALGSLRNVDFGKGLQTIGNGAFGGCTALSGLILPPSVTSVGYGAFSNMGNGSGVVWYYGGNSRFYRIDEWGVSSDNLKPYRILTVKAENGTVTASGAYTPAALAANNWFLAEDAVTLTPAAGYELTGLTVTSGESLPVTDGAFTIPPDGDVTVSATLTRLTSVAGDLTGETLTAAVIAPDGGVLIAAAYDASGRQQSVRTVAVTAEDTEPVDTGIAVENGYTYKLMLVDANYAPLCEAWDSAAQARQ